jgi:hypothetical protein
MSDVDGVLALLTPLQDGWGGEGSKAPPPQALVDIATAISSLTFPFSPEIEVDPDDGHVVLRWLAADQSFSLTFLGAGFVAGYLNGPSLEPAWRLPVADASGKIAAALGYFTRA